MFAELIEWVMSLDREFAFLLALPFVVAIAGFIAEAVRTREPRASTRPQTRDARATHIGSASHSGI
jgi:hypothetical protein